MTISQYTLFDAARGDVLFNAQTIANILAGAATPVGLNLPGTTSGKFLKWNVVDSLLDVRGQTKLILRPTTEAFGVQIKTEFTGTATEHFANQITADWTAAGVSSGGLRADYALARLAATYTMAGTANLLGAENLLQFDGTVNGSGLHAGNYSAILAGAGTLTAVGHLAARWADSHLAAAPGSGNLSFDYISNNGAAQFGQVWYVYGGDKITNLMALDTVAGMVAAGGTGAPSGTVKKIKMLIDGVAYYLVASTIVS